MINLLWDDAGIIAECDIYIYIYSGFNRKPEACRGDFGPGFWSTVLLGR